MSNQRRRPAACMPRQTFLKGQKATLQQGDGGGFPRPWKLAAGRRRCFDMAEPGEPLGAACVPRQTFLEESKSGVTGRQGAVSASRGRCSRESDVRKQRVWLATPGETCSFAVLRGGASLWGAACCLARRLLFWLEGSLKVTLINSDRCALPRPWKLAAGPWRCFGMAEPAFGSCLRGPTQLLF